MKEAVEIDSDTSSDVDIDINTDSDDNENNGTNKAPEGNRSSGPAKPTSVSATETNKDVIKLRLWCAFTTQSMALAYASSEDERPQVFVFLRTCFGCFSKKCMIVIHSP